MNKDVQQFSEELTATELKRRHKLEEQFESCLDRWLEGSEALWEIKRDKLYRSTHSSFADYCQQVWDIGSRRAYQLINAAEVSKELPEDVKGKVGERAVRAAKGRTPKEKADVIKKAAAKKGGRTPTAKDVGEMNPADIDTSDAAPQVITTDEEGNAVTAMADQAVFDSRAEFDRLMKTLRAVKKDAKQLMSQPGGAMLRTAIMADINNSIEALKFARPHAMADKAKHNGHKRTWFSRGEWEAIKKAGK